MLYRIGNLRFWLLPALCLVFTGGGWALASIPGSDGRISACYSSLNGGVRIVDSAARCRPLETAIRWNQQGAQGPTGPPGPAGPGTSVVDAFEAGTITVAREDTPNEQESIEHGGPTLTVDVPAGGALVQLMNSVEIRLREACSATIKLREIPDDSAQPTIVTTNVAGRATEDFFTLYSNLQGGVEQGGEWIVRHLPAGAHTFRLRYRVEGAPESPCAMQVRNRHLYAIVLA